MRSSRNVAAIVSTRSHYEVLGVHPEATAEVIREAYRNLAREHHPDRRAIVLDSSHPMTMAELNEAYRVLRDPGRRAVYDASLRTGSAAPQSAPPPRQAQAQSHTEGMKATAAEYASHLVGRPGPARVPWRTLMFFGTLAIIGVIVLAQFTDSEGLKEPDGILRVGDCVEIEADGDAHEISCVGDEDVDLVVRAFVTFDASCPNGSEAHRDRLGMGVACVAVPE